MAHQKDFFEAPPEERRKELVTVASAKIMTPLLGNLVNRSSRLVRSAHHSGPGHGAYGGQEVENL